MRLVEWSALPGLCVLSQTYWIVFEIPRDGATWCRGLFVSSWMDIGRLRGEQYAVYTRMSANITLSSNIPGLAVFKALLCAIDDLSIPVSTNRPHVTLTRYYIDTRHGVASF
jgi:hypothetical protein